jgi:hypothetical protein
MLRIGDCLVDRPQHAISHIILCGHPRLLESRFPKFSNRSGTECHGLSYIGTPLECFARCRSWKLQETHQITAT